MDDIAINSADEAIFSQLHFLCFLFLPIVYFLLFLISFEDGMQFDRLFGLLVFEFGECGGEIIGGGDRWFLD
jgi:hypothetical protein